MSPTWLFEADVFGQTADPLKAEIRRLGLWCHVTRQDLLARGHGDAFGGHRIAPDDCVIACGWFPFVRFVLDHRRWAPGGWCIPEALACSAYYPHFGPYLLNRRHLFTTGVEAVRDRDAIFAALGRGGRVFVRPDGCQKTFTGRVVGADEFDDALAPARYDPATRVVVAEPRPIARDRSVPGPEPVGQFTDGGRPGRPGGRDAPAGDPHPAGRHLHPDRPAQLGHDLRQPLPGRLARNRSALPPAAHGLSPPGAILPTSIRDTVRPSSMSWPLSPTPSAAPRPAA